MQTEPITYPWRLTGAEMEHFLPHRAPMLFVQEVEVLSDTHFTGVAAWQADSPVLAGHFRGCPIVPGVCLLEAAAQVALIGATAGDPISRADAPGRLAVLAGILRCSFKRPVRPGEQVVYDVHTRRMDNYAGTVKASAHVSGQLVANLEFLVYHLDIATLGEMMPVDELLAQNLDVYGFDRLPARLTA